jgi:hypothetical protein
MATNWYQSLVNICLGLVMATTKFDIEKLERNISQRYLARIAWLLPWTKMKISGSKSALGRY